MTRFFSTLFFGLFALAAHAANPQVELKTNMGSIVLELNAELAPLSTANFLKYVNDHRYDGTIFHRVIDGFMIQGGGLDEQLDEKQTYAPIENESRNGLRNEIGTVAMARTNAPHSATSQFFINVANNSFLDYDLQRPTEYGYAVFGKVVQGMDVVQKIARLPTQNRGRHQNVPVQVVVIESARQLESTPEAEPATPTAAPNRDKSAKTR